MSDVFERVRAVIVEELEVDEETVVESATLQEDLGMGDDFALEFTMPLEEEFEVEIDDEKFQTCKTVGDIVKYLEELL